MLVRIFRGVAFSLIALFCRLKSTFWWDQSTGVDPAQPLTLSLTPTRTQNGPETGQKCGCAAFGSSEKTCRQCWAQTTIPKCGPLLVNYEDETSPKDPYYRIVRSTVRYCTAVAVAPHFHFPEHHILPVVGFTSSGKKNLLPLSCACLELFPLDIALE